MAGIGAGLFLGMDHLREYEHLRAPWTGTLSIASGLAFVGAGVLGRGWRAILASVLIAGLGALVLTDPWTNEPLTTGVPESCDPGCLTPGFAIAITVTVPAALAIAGIAIRRTVQFLHPKIA